MHNIYKDWNPNTETVGSRRQSTYNSFKKNLTKKVNFSNTKSNLTVKLANITTLTSMDKIDEMMNTVRTKSGTYRKTNRSSNNYGHNIVKILDNAKKDNILREKLKNLLKT